MRTTESLAKDVGVKGACDALAVPRSGFYRWLDRGEETTSKDHRVPSPLALSQGEQQVVLDTLHTERFADQTPREVYAALLDEGTYLCSVRTMYRILEKHNEVRERRNQLSHPQYQKPELPACAPNEIWSWDITKLKGPVNCQRSFQSEPFSVVKSEPPCPHDWLISTPSFPTFPRSL